MIVSFQTNDSYIGVVVGTVGIINWYGMTGSYMSHLQVETAPGPSEDESFLSHGGTTSYHTCSSR